MVKRWFALLLTLTLSLGWLTPRVAAATASVFFFDETTGSYGREEAAVTVSVTVNGKALTGDMPAVAQQGRTLVPVRTFCEMLGYDVLWLETARQAVIFTGWETVTFPLGSTEARVNGLRASLPNGVSAQAVRRGNVERTMVPLRFLVETLGGAVSWDGVTAHAVIAPDTKPRAVAVLDAGHGGTASGAVYGGVKEKDLVFPITVRAAELLQQAGVGVLLTRSGDEDVGLYERASMGNAVQGDVFVSVHANAAPGNAQFGGTYTYAYPNSSSGEKLSERIQRACVERAGLTDRGIMTENFVVLRETKMPAALLETGFMTCPDDLKRLTQPETQENFAQGIAQGVLDYLARDRSL